MKEFFKGKRVTSLPYHQEYTGRSMDVGVIEDVVYHNGYPAFKMDDDDIIVLSKRNDSFGNIDKGTKRDLFFSIFPIVMILALLDFLFSYFCGIIYIININI